MKQSVLLTIFVLFTSGIYSQEIKKNLKQIKTAFNQTAKSPENKSNIYKVKKENFKISFKAKGQLVPSKFQIIKLTPKRWKTFKIIKLKKHGDKVKKGDSIIEFESKGLLKNIEKQENSLQLAELKLKEALLKKEHMSISNKLALESSTTKSNRLKEDVDEYFKNGQKWSKLRNEDYRKRVAEYLLYNMEELKQLEKMYKEDDLTEETEEIILTRQKHSVNHMKLWDKETEYQTNLFKLKYLPRMNADQKKKLEANKISLAFLKASIPLAIELLEKGIENQQKSLKELKEAIKELKEDQSLLKINAEIDGILYYGNIDESGWSHGQNTMNSLKINLIARLLSPLITVASNKRLSVYSQMQENNLQWLNAKLQGKMKPVAYPNEKYNCQVEKVDRIPSGKFMFNTLLKFKPESKKVTELFPGYNVDLQFTPIDLKDVMSIPLAFLKTKDERNFVYIKSDNKEKFIERNIEIGLRNNTTVLIKKGLKIDDILLKDKPKKKIIKKSKTEKAESKNAK